MKAEAFQRVVYWRKGDLVEGVITRVAKSDSACSDTYEIVRQTWTGRKREWVSGMDIRGIISGVQQ